MSMRSEKSFWMLLSRWVSIGALGTTKAGQSGGQGTGRGGGRVRGQSRDTVTDGMGGLYGDTKAGEHGGERGMRGVSQHGDLRCMGT